MSITFVLSAIFFWIDLSELFSNGTEVDTDILRTLLKAIKNEHRNEFDFLSFKQSVKNLIGMDMDQATSVRSAFATAATMGMTKQKLLESGQKYQYALENERTSFANALKNQMEIKVNGKKQEAVLLKKKIEEYKNKIADMEREMQVFQNKIDKVDENMELGRQKIHDTKTRFENTYDVVFNSIKTDLDLIDQIL